MWAYIDTQFLILLTKSGHSVWIQCGHRGDSVWTQYRHYVDTMWIVLKFYIYILTHSTFITLIDVQNKTCHMVTIGPILTKFNFQ